eukprot:CAMPEP_0185167414 /NCGR_PEP_ID=MMETSP1139-20130426/14222_1 /TAXON_ID=298111 /ORGANISM="Pavlova sp., Strain CCMP459" /LENGTH=54 /DNA_ID=CAMNT_0027732895 /DNA_START=419 /DNA_END=581 /DNA_ORIENTATION=-
MTISREDASHDPPSPGQMTPLRWHGSEPQGLSSSSNEKGGGESGHGRCTEQLCM